MAQMEQEDAQDGFEQYPNPQRLGEELRPDEPSNAELEAARSGLWLGVQVPQKTNWPVLVVVVAFLVVLIVVTFITFPLDTWEFRVGP